MSTCADILLVEDNASDAELTLHALRTCTVKLEVVRVCDGAEALDYLFAQGAYASRDPDALPRCILLDLKLPKVNGLQVLDAVRNHPRTRTVPCVVLTSSREQGDIQRCYELGVNSYVVKPVDFDRFTRTIQGIGRYWLTTNEAKDA